MDEKTLVNKIIQNDKKAIRKLYDLYSERLGNYIKGKIDNRADVEEILNDVFASTINSLPNFNFKSKLYSYMCAIANHEVADFYRRKKLKTILFSRFPFLETLASAALTPEEETLKNELKNEIKKTLSQINQRHSRVLVLKYLKGFSVKEIAHKLQATEKAIESCLTRARKNFALAWEKDKY